MSGWICCQRGAREHYGVPRALHRRGALELLLVDAWCPPGNLFARFLPALRTRCHPELKTAPVRSWNGPLVAAEMRQRLFPAPPYRHQYKLNRKFQSACVRALRAWPADFSPAAVFAYSYAAKDILAYAKDRGWKTVLGQIDPGPREMEIVIEEYRRHGWPPGPFAEAPAGYWDDWRCETESADHIVVNSPWSARNLAASGVPASKLVVVPCAYEGPGPREFQRVYPDAFTAARPLEVLFLGQVLVRKGIHLLLQAAAQLQDVPVRFTIVGGGKESFLPAGSDNVRWVGPVPRDRCAEFYRQADVFVLPTLSDGFGLTQLEALSWKLPLISSEHCGDVVVDGTNGVVLKDLRAERLAEALRLLVREPGVVQRLSDGAVVSSRFSLDAIGQQLLEKCA